MDARSNIPRDMLSVCKVCLKKDEEAVVVFDGYVGKSTETTHARRTKEHAGVTVAFTSNMQLTMSKAKFLANKTNKQQFIKMLGDQLEMNNCKAHHAPRNADLLIVQKSVESAPMSTTILVGDDTDLLILLCYHSSLHFHRVFSNQSQRRARRIRACGTYRLSRNS